MQFYEYSNGSRTLLVMFTCKRCGRTEIELLESHEKDMSDSYGYLHYIKPPEGWKDLLHGPLLCPDCFNDYQLFMQNKTKKE